MQQNDLAHPGARNRATEPIAVEKHPLPRRRHPSLGGLLLPYWPNLYNTSQKAPFHFSGPQTVKLTDIGDRTLLPLPRLLGKTHITVVNDLILRVVNLVTEARWGKRRRGMISAGPLKR